MNNWITSTVTWTEFIVYTLIFLGVYLLMRLLYRLAHNVGYWPWHRRSIDKYIRILLVMYEPIAVIIIMALFVLINPTFHGIIIGIILISSISVLRSYLNGRVLLWDATLSEGLRIITSEDEGVISTVGRIGIRMKCNDGLQYINYTRLMHDGYMIASGEYAGGYCEMILDRMENQSKDRGARYLEDKLISSPYLDIRHRPEVKAIDEGERWQVKVLVRHKRHEVQLVDLIREWGYDPVIIND